MLRSLTSCINGRAQSQTIRPTVIPLIHILRVKFHYELWNSIWFTHYRWFWCMSVSYCERHIIHQTGKSKYQEGIHRGDSILRRTSSLDCCPTLHIGGKSFEIYNGLDEQLELSIEVLEDFSQEAKEVGTHNPWRNYALPYETDVVKWVIIISSLISLMNAG